MKSSDIRELSTKELEMKLAEIKQELLNLRFSHATGSLKNPKQITLLKKDIARILTVLKIWNRLTYLKLYTIKSLGTGLRQTEGMQRFV